MSNVFSVAGFMVFLRESLEASIIIAVLLQFVKKTVMNPTHLNTMRKRIWLGAGLGVLLSIIIGAALSIVFYVVGQNYFNSETEKLYEGILITMAVFFITLIAFKMLSIDRLLEKWKAKTAAAIKSQTHENALDNSVGSGSAWGLFVLSFTIVLREGLESVIFITGVNKGDSPVSLILPAICGISVGVLVGFLVFRGGQVLSLNIFFKVSFVFLLFIAAGLSAYGAHEIEEYVYIQLQKSDPTITAKETPVLWDVSSCCSHKGNAFWQILNVVFGWRSKATVATTAAYFGYWIIIIFITTVYFIRRRNVESASKEEVAEDEKRTVVQVI
jgi:high-affinity iron transporter